MHTPTSGDIDALRNCFVAAHSNGLLPVRTDRQQWPLLTVDRGYNVKRGYPALVQDFRVHSVARYPSHWNLVHRSTPSSSGVAVGPVQVAGAFYCPAVLGLINERRHVRSMRELLENKAFRDHDSYLRRILPFLMGRNSRPYRARSRRVRPKLGVLVEEVTKLDLVCPASLGNVACPLKAESMASSAPGAPLAEPTWNADTYLCCRQSSVTVTLTTDQQRMAQHGPVPATWEHALVYESNRAETERRFSRVKGRDGSGLSDLCSGPRREPLIALAVACAFAAVNVETQRHFNPDYGRTHAFDIKMRLLREDPGREPAKPPPLS